jgi:GIY-YIG catalytic domain-containing protein
VTALWGLLWSVVIVAAVRIAWWLYRAWTAWRPTAVYQILTEQGSEVFAVHGAGRELDALPHGGRVYIGKTVNIGTRMRSHRAKSSWFSLANDHFRITLEPDLVTVYRTEALALEAEAELIRKYQPMGNTVGTSRQKKVITGE